MTTLHTQPTPQGRNSPPDAATRWVTRAACRGLDPALFHPERGESTREAKAVCATCLVRPECLEHALARAEKHGIWGGLAEYQRRPLRRARRAARHQEAA